MLNVFFIIFFLVRFSLMLNKKSLDSIVWAKTKHLETRREKKLQSGI